MSSLPSTPKISTSSLLKIEIGGHGSIPYKSIDELTWDNIPPFAVLTGLNGSGKTQLLELLAYKLTGTEHPELGQLTKVRVIVEGDTFSPDSVAYLPNRWDITGTQMLGIAQLQKVKMELRQQLGHHNTQRNRALQARRMRIERLLGVTSIQGMSQEEFAQRLPNDFAFMLDDENITQGLAYVFLAYRLQVAEERERGTPETDIVSKLRPAPWDVLNETFKAAEFPYRVVSPMKTGFLDPYQFLLEDSQTGLRIKPADLSSGEIKLLGLVLWLYNSRHHGRFPRLLLLDEPDGHLHPSMTRHFLNVIKEVLVDQYNVRVIITTHSPSTVALVPDESVFEMSRTKPRITPSKSKAETIGLLTAGFVIVSASTRYVLVEDNDDVQFYNTIRDILSDYGPSRDPRAIKSAPSIVFLRASLGSGTGKIGGGKSVVTQWVDKLDQAPLNEIFRGVIDRDTGNAPTNRVYVLSRYSIENYLLDPFVVYGVLLDQGTAPAITGVSISPGDEHRLRSLSEAELQAIVNEIRSMVEPIIAPVPRELNPHPVTFTNGQTVQYPRWMADRRGHDLLPLYQSALGGSSVISPPRLYKSLRRVRLIPVELADILDRLQG